MDRIELLEIIEEARDLVRVAGLEYEGDVGLESELWDVYSTLRKMCEMPAPSDKETIADLKTRIEVLEKGED